MFVVTRTRLPSATCRTVLIGLTNKKSAQRLCLKMPLSIKYGNRSNCMPPILFQVKHITALLNQTHLTRLFHKKKPAEGRMPVSPLP